MSLPEFDLNGKTAIVTGGGRGLGKGIALALAEAGANVTIAGRTESKLVETSAEILAAGGQCLFVVTDVTRDEDIVSLIDRTVETFGKIDILVNNAGVAIVKPLVPTSKLTNEVQHSVKVLSWERVMDMSPLKRGVRLPDYKPRDTRSAKSRQVWIPRHLQWLGS